MRWAGDDRVRWSVQVVDVDDDRVLLDVDAAAILRTASIAKVVLLLELAARIESGEVDPDALLDRRVTPSVADSGLWHLMAADVLPVRDVALLVASVSDNWAANVLVQQLGLDEVRARGMTAGLTQSRLQDLVRDHRGPADAPTLSVGAAAEWAHFLARLHRREVETPAVAERLLAWLSTDVDHSLVAAPLALDPLVTSVGALAHKTGCDRGVRADVGLLTRHGRTLAYAAVANWDDADGDLAGAVVADLHRLGATLVAELDA